MSDTGRLTLVGVGTYFATLVLCMVAHGYWSAWRAEKRRKPAYTPSDKPKAVGYVTDVSEDADGVSITGNLTPEAADYTRTYLTESARSAGKTRSIEEMIQDLDTYTDYVQKRCAVKTLEEGRTLRCIKDKHTTGEHVSRYGDTHVFWYA